MGMLERVADPKDTLRSDLEAARAWGVPPTVFLRERTAPGPWSDRDTEYARALAEFEARLCSRGHDTAETLKVVNSDAYVGETIGECQKCVAVDIEVGRWDGYKRAAALLFGVTGPDPDIVARNTEALMAAGRSLGGTATPVEDAAEAEPEPSQVGAHLL